MFQGYSFQVEIFSQTWIAKAKPQVSWEKTESQGIVQMRCGPIILLQ